MPGWKDCRRGWSVKPGEADADDPLAFAATRRPAFTAGGGSPLAFSLVGSNVPPFKTLLSADELRRAERLLDSHKAQAFIVGRGRLRQILGSYLQSDPAAIEFAYGADGKPALHRPQARPLQFNLSHSGNWAVLALSAGVAIGVDLEKIDLSLDYASLAARFFSAAENARLLAVSPPRRRRSFYRLWTRKEALLKGQGRGFTASTEVEERSWQLRSFWLGLGYVGEIACAGEIQVLRRWQVGAEK